MARIPMTLPLDELTARIPPANPKSVMRLDTHANLFISLRNVTIAGFFLLLPVILAFLVVTKAWVSLSSVGTRIANIFGMKSVIGLGGTTVFTGLLSELHITER